MKPLRLILVALLLPVAGAAQAPTVAPFVPGTNTLFSADFSAAGTVPVGVRFTRGAPEWGQQGGISMLKATTSTDFILDLPDVLPQQFTIEADVFTSSNAAEVEFAVQGTIGMTGTTRSALVVWHHAYAAVFRGGAAAGDKYYYPSAALLPELRNQVAHIQIVMDGTHFTYFTNDEQLADIPDLVFKRDKFLQVHLGGAAILNGEVYLAQLRIGSNSGAAGVIAANPAPPTMTRPGSAGALANPPQVATTASGPVRGLTGLRVDVDAQGSAKASWDAVPGATYLAMRWKVGDAACCNNVSPPGTPLSGAGWQDATLPGAGTYGYRVIAMTASGMVSTETQTNWAGAGASTTATSPSRSGTIANRNAPAPTTAVPPAPTPVTPVLVAPATGTITPMPPTSATPPTSTPPQTGAAGGQTPVTTMAPTATGMTTSLAPTSVRVVKVGPTTAQVLWDKSVQAAKNPAEIYPMYIVERWSEGDAAACPSDPENQDSRCKFRNQAWEQPWLYDYDLEGNAKYFYRVWAGYLDEAKCANKPPEWGKEPCPWSRWYAAAPVEFTLPLVLNPMAFRSRPQFLLSLAATWGTVTPDPYDPIYTRGTVEITWKWKPVANAAGYVIAIDEIGRDRRAIPYTIVYVSMHQETLPQSAAPSVSKWLFSRTSYRTCVGVIMNPAAIPDPLKGECMVLDQTEIP